MEDLGILAYCIWISNKFIIIGKSAAVFKGLVVVRQASRMPSWMARERPAGGNRVIPNCQDGWSFGVHALMEVILILSVFGPAKYRATLVILCDTTTGGWEEGGRFWNPSYFRDHE